ncbi:MAG: hypothetical protein K6G23_07630 [Lachnospiraceae bacterium]|nr:hypothetical protein [Lachnospiraceae bacterium]
MGNRKQTGLGLRLVVAAYLIYLGVKMFGTDVENISPYLAMFFSIAFVIIGIIYGVFAIKTYRSATSEEAHDEQTIQESAAKEDTQTVQESVTKEDTQAVQESVTKDEEQ